MAEGLATVAPDTFCGGPRESIKTEILQSLKVESASRPSQPDSQPAAKPGSQPSQLASPSWLSGSFAWPGQFGLPAGFKLSKFETIVKLSNFQTFLTDIFKLDCFKHL